MSPIKDPAVRSAFDEFPSGVREQLLMVRDLILSVAAKNEDVGIIEETLKWGEPAYLTSESKSGSTIRLGWKKSAPDQYAIYLNCRTTLVDTFRTLYPELTYEGNRAIVFETGAHVPLDALSHCLEMALMYHHAKRR